MAIAPTQRTLPTTCIARQSRRCWREISRVWGNFARIAASTLLGLCLAAGHCSAAQAAASRDEPIAYLAGKVTRVVDGDTIDVLLASGRIRVRLHGIDAPESNQPGGSAASTWLRQQLRDRQVLLEPISQDQYDRLVAVVHLQDRNINRELVQQGHAWAYRRYMRRGDRELCSLEDRARRGRAGLWAVAAPHAPWEHRSTKGKGPFASYEKSTVEQCRKTIGRR